MFDIFDKYWQKDIRGKRLKRSTTIEDWEHGVVSPEDPTLPDSKNIAGGSLFFLYLFLFLALAAMFGRLGYLEVVKGDELKARAENNHTRAYITRSLRGIMYDRQGTLLVENVPKNNASLIPADLPRDPALRRSIVTDLSLILSLPEDEIRQKIQEYEFLYYPITLKEDIDHETKLALLLKYPENKHGVVVTEDFYRHYLFGTTLSHVLGYVGKITRAQWESHQSDYHLDSELGKVGLEASYEALLRGHNGERLINVNAQGNFVSTLATSESVAGCDLTLSVDQNLQDSVHAILEQAVKVNRSTGAVAIVMNPQSGELLSVVSVPDYDDNLFSNGIVGDAETKDFETLNHSDKKPFLNRAIGGVYPPGSVFKLVTASSALQAGVLTENTVLDSPGLISIPNQFNPEEHFVYKDWKAEGHGSLNVIQAIAESSDTFFYKVSGGFENFSGLGVDRLKTYGSLFGLGHTLGIDLPGEVAGTFPDEAWKLERIGAQWYTGDTYNLGIGQGYLLTTPLQVAAYTMAVANGGTLYRPMLLKEASHCEGAFLAQPLVLNKDFIQPEYLNLVRRGMRLAVTSDHGTAKALRDFPIQVAGKTGTAQYDNNQKEHSWFTAFAPYDHPEVVVTVLVEGAGEGGDVALPVARQVLSDYFAGKE